MSKKVDPRIPKEVGTGLYPVKSPWDKMLSYHDAAHYVQRYTNVVSAAIMQAFRVLVPDYKERSQAMCINAYNRLSYVYQAIPGYTKITSPFGKRKSPTSGASSSHSGIDIGAPEGTNLYAVCDGEITFTQFLGAGGYTITLSSKNLKITYCHVSPNYIVKKGDLVKQGQKIGNVGPKYVFGVPGNQYQDSSGKPTNGATTGTHLHFGIRVDGKYVDPLLYFK